MKFYPEEERCHAKDFISSSRLIRLIPKSPKGTLICALRVFLQRLNILTNLHIPQGFPGRSRQLPLRRHPDHKVAAGQIEFSEGECQGSIPTARLFPRRKVRPVLLGWKKLSPCRLFNRIAHHVIFDCFLLILLTTLLNI